MALQLLMSHGVGAVAPNGACTEHTFQDLVQRLQGVSKAAVVQHARLLLSVVENTLRGSRRPSIKEAPLLCGLDPAQVSPVLSTGRRVRACTALLGGACHACR